MHPSHALEFPEVGIAFSYVQDEKQASMEQVITTFASVPWQNLALFGMTLAIAVGAVSIHDVVVFVRSLIGGQ